MLYTECITAEAASVKGKWMGSSIFCLAAAFFITLGKGWFVPYDASFRRCKVRSEADSKPLDTGMKLIFFCSKPNTVEAKTLLQETR